MGSIPAVGLEIFVREFHCSVHYISGLEQFGNYHVTRSAHL